MNIHIPGAWTPSRINPKIHKGPEYATGRPSSSSVIRDPLFPFYSPKCQLHRKAAASGFQRLLIHAWGGVGWGDPDQEKMWEPAENDASKTKKGENFKREKPNNVKCHSKIKKQVCNSWTSQGITLTSKQAPYCNIERNQKLTSWLTLSCYEKNKCTQRVKSSLSSVDWAPKRGLI